VFVDTTGGTVEFRRVAYDIERAAAAVVSAGLPPLFARELREARGYVPELDDVASAAG
jgi:hypothetical protein